MLASESKITEEKQLVERVLASGLFRKSPRLSSFLRFVYDEQVKGRENAINEQLIGTEVFGRRSGYHVGEDSIVRSQARFLRQRLEQYFETEGRHESLILTIPKGSYVPAFKEREPRGKISGVIPSVSPDLPDAESSTSGTYSHVVPLTPTDVSFKSSRRLRSLGILAASAFVLLAGVSYFAIRERKPAPSRDEAIIHTFWASVFTPKRSVLFVPADSSLVTWEKLSGKQVHLSSYMSKDYAKAPPDDSGVWERLQNSRYTSLADLDLVYQLDRIPEVANSRFQIRYGGDLSLTELKASNAILSGGPRSNPWVELFASSMHFDVGYDLETRHNFVRDRSGSSKPDDMYVEMTDAGAEGYQSYGVIGYLPSLDGQGHDLLVEGTSKAGTEAAAEFLQSGDFVHFLREMGANETSIPNFEILISAHGLVGGDYSPKVVAWHKLPVS